MGYVFYKPEEACTESIFHFRKAFSNKNIGAFIWIRALDNGMLKSTTDKDVSLEYDCYNKELATKALELVYKRIKANPQWGMNVISHAKPDEGYMKIRFLKKPRPKKRKTSGK